MQFAAIVVAALQGFDLHLAPLDDATRHAFDARTKLKRKRSACVFAILRADGHDAI